MIMKKGNIVNQSCSFNLGIKGEMLFTPRAYQLLGYRQHLYSSKVFIKRIGLSLMIR
jgi:hypothetical protein